MENEVFKDVKGYEGLYLISNYGKLISLPCKGRRKEKCLKGSLHKGYIYYKLSFPGVKYKAFAAHKLVAIHYLNSVDGKNTVNHIDSNIKNNHYSNLEWVTIGENIRHYWKNRPNTPVIRLHKKRKLFNVINSLLSNKLNSLTNL